MWTVMQLAATQWRRSVEAIAAGGAVHFFPVLDGLDYPAVLAIAGTVPGITVDFHFVNCLRIFEAEVLKRHRRAAARTAACSPEQQARCKYEHGEYYEWVHANCEKNPARTTTG